MERLVEMMGEVLQYDEWLSCWRSVLADISDGPPGLIRRQQLSY